MHFSSQLVETVAREGVNLARKGGGAQALFLRRLLLDASQPAGTSVHNCNARSSPTSAIQKKKLRVSGESRRVREGPRTSAGARRAGAVEPSRRRRVGVVVGATLRSVLQFAGVDVSRSCARQVRHLVRFFEPVVGAVSRVEGDREVLASGLACHRVLREQRRHMAEARDAGGAVRKPWLSRKGLKNVAMGVTASVLVAHHIAAQEGADAETIASGLGECCEHAEAALHRWNVTDASDRGVSIEVLRAEARALGRARAAFTAAAEHAREHRLDRADALRLQLETMRRAAWPAGERCDAESHDELCARIATGLPLGNNAMPSPMPASASVPLSAIPAEAWLEDGSGGSEVDMDDDGASSAVSSHPSISSISSHASSRDASDTELYERVVSPTPGMFSEALLNFAFRVG